jgi:hypothetical protein
VLGRAASGKQLDAERREAFGKLEKTGFVRNREQGAGNGHEKKGRVGGAE